MRKRYREAFEKCEVDPTILQGLTPEGKSMLARTAFTHYPGGIVLLTRKPQEVTPDAHEHYSNKSAGQNSFVNYLARQTSKLF